MGTLLHAILLRMDLQIHIFLQWQLLSKYFKSFVIHGLSLTWNHSGSLLLNASIYNCMMHADLTYVCAKRFSTVNFICEDLHNQKPYGKFTCSEHSKSN